MTVGRDSKVFEFVKLILRPQKVAIKQAGRKIAWNKDCKMQKKSLVEGCEDFQTQRRAVNGKTAGEWWSASTVYFALEAKIGPGVKSSHLGQNQRMRNKGHEAFVLIEKGGG